MTRRRNRPVDINYQSSGNDVLSVRFPTELLDRIEVAAKRDGVTISEYVRRQFTSPPRLTQAYLHPPTENPTRQTWLVRL